MTRPEDHVRTRTTGGAAPAITTEYDPKVAGDPPTVVIEYRRTGNPRAARHRLRVVRAYVDHVGWGWVQGYRVKANGEPCRARTGARLYVMLEGLELRNVATVKADR